MNFHQMQARHDRFRKFVIVVIAIIFVAVIAMFGFMGYVAVEAFDMIKTDSLKSVIDTIWNGTGK